MQIIKDGAIVADEVRHLADDEAATGGSFTVSLARWQAEKASLLASGASLGVRLQGGDSVAALVEDLPRLDRIIVEFPAMADGRGFSLARLLRERYGYTGEIRATGDYIRDQVHYLARVGVNAFEPKPDSNPEALLPAFAEFTVHYQAAADDPRPLYRRRG